MSWTKGWGMLALAALLGLRPAAAGAVPLLGEDFERGVGVRADDVAREKPGAGGWRAEKGGDVRMEGAEYLRYPAGGRISPEEGTVEFEGVRDESGGRLEAFFSLLPAEGSASISVRIWWDEYRLFKDTPILEVALDGHQSPWYRRGVDKRRGRWTDDGIPMGGIRRGQRFHVAVTWGPDANDFALYVNGSKLNALVRRSELENFREAIRQAKWIVIGSEPDSEGSWSQVHSVVKSLHIHDQAIPGNRLLANPELFRTPLTVSAVSDDAGRVAGFSGKLVAGNTIGVTVEGTRGATATFDVAHYPDLDRRIPLDWRGWGVYLEEKRFFAEGEVDLREVEGYRVYVADRPFNPLTTDATPLAELDVKEQTYVVENLEIDTPYYVAVVAVMRDGTLRTVMEPIAGEPLAETAPGVYTGSRQFGYQDRYPRAVVVGRLRLGDRVEKLAGATPFAVDPGLTIAVATEPNVLKADEKSTSKVTVIVTDANGNAVPGHEIRFLLATTSQYTGVVGGGAFSDQVGGAIKTDLRGETDLFGRLTATYVAGFAAKTAVIVARDMTANSTGSGFVTTFIQATAQLELEPAAQTEAMAAGYRIEVTSSDSWLTADGKSQAHITALVTRAGKAVEGHQVAFRVASGTGQVRVVRAVTDRSGEARAVYTAGTKIGVVLITATDTTVDISGSVQIELRSDAPAKIAVKTDPAKLPADGRSRAELSVLVTDVNDNPNDNVAVEYAIAEGDGSLEEDKSVTDRRGETANTFTAGRTPGRVSIELTVRSPAPTEEEVARARELAVEVPDYRFRRR